MKVDVSAESDGSISLSVDGVEKSDLHDVVRELLYTALSTRRKEKQEKKDDIVFERSI